MDAEIRYGSEVNLYRAIGQTNPEILRSFENRKRNILSFSHSVRYLPDEPDFGPLLTELGFAYFSDEPVTARDTPDIPVLPPIRVIEIIDAPPTDFVRIKRLGDGLINLTAGSGRLVHGGVVFFDHTTAAEGIRISSFNASPN